MFRDFWDEYRRHPGWVMVLLMILMAGLIFDSTLIHREPPLSSPISGVTTA